MHLKTITLPASFCNTGLKKYISAFKECRDAERNLHQAVQDCNPLPGGQTTEGSTTPAKTTANDDPTTATGKMYLKFYKRPR